MGLRVAYHAACSLQHGQKIKDAPKALLRRAGFEVVEPADPHLCCGSAGTYNLMQPEISAELKARKVATLEAQAPGADRRRQHRLHGADRVGHRRAGGAHGRTARLGDGRAEAGEARRRVARGPAEPRRCHILAPIRLATAWRNGPGHEQTICVSRGISCRRPAAMRRRGRISRASSTADDSRGWEGVGRLDIGGTQFLHRGADRREPGADRRPLPLRPGDRRACAARRDRVSRRLARRACGGLPRRAPSRWCIPATSTTATTRSLDLALIELDRPIRNGSIIPFETGKRRFLSRRGGRGVLCPRPRRDALDAGYLPRARPGRGHPGARLRCRFRLLRRAGLRPVRRARRGSSRWCRPRARWAIRKCRSAPTSKRRWPRCWRCSQRRRRGLHPVRAPRGRAGPRRSACRDRGQVHPPLTGWPAPVTGPTLKMRPVRGGAR